MTTFSVRTWKIQGSKPRADRMGYLGACLVIAFFHSRQRRRVGLGDGEGQITFRNAAEDVVGKHAPEDRAGADAAAVVAAEGDDVVGEAMEAWQCVVGHADH